MKKLFLIIGAPGSGKTTDANLIAEKHPDRLVHYSTGDMLRAEVASGSELGREIESYISRGALVPLDIIVDTIVSAINQAPVPNVLIDGYPRSVEQMEAFDAIVSQDDGIELAAVIEVRVSEAVARERILGRAAEAAPGEGRSDDNEEVFNDRMKIYTEPLEAIQNFYTDKGLLHVIDGERTLEEVVADMDAFVTSHLP
jgi:adenylate kinase